MFPSTAFIFVAAIASCFTGVFTAPPRSSSHINYTTVTGYFLQDEASTNASTFNFLNTNFGLINRTYTTDAAYNPTGKKTQWQRFANQVFRLNRESGHSVQYKLLFIGRHGEGYHNAAESYYGTPAWNCYYSELDGNGTVTWADARLTPKGIAQALTVNAFWASEIKNQKVPTPQSYYTSPLTRCLATANLTFSGLDLPSRHPFVPTVEELFREGISGHTCDRRGTKSYIQSAFPKYKIEPGFAETDQLWQAYHGETQVDQDIRSRAVLDDVFSSDSETYISITSHSGEIASLLRGSYFLFPFQRAVLTDCTGAQYSATEPSLSLQVSDLTSSTMAEVHALDDYYLAITLLITIAYQLFFFSIAFSLKFDKLTDFAGGTNFVVLAIITLAFSGHHHARQIVCSLFIMLWGARLSGFLLFRIIKTGKDDRFDDKRDKFWSFLGFWVFQMIWVWTVSLPVTILNSPNVTKFDQPAFGTGRDIAGVILFAIGFILESVSDVQKYLFRSNPENKGKVCDIGFFTWTRHPNYFGEIIIQFCEHRHSACGYVTNRFPAIFMIAVSPSAYGYVTGGAFSAQYAAILGPFFLTLLLMFVSGLTLQERPGAKKRYESGNHWESFSRYTKRTSILTPFPPQLYERMPTILKRTIFLEFPIYVFDPAKHADQSKVRDREAEEGNGQSQQGEDNSHDGAANHQ
ncbi:MAG: hypothetical protein L6R40_008115 [Gallowayella cf. fulva]|nr:MAG: hypothetical protein L6R40_008115 [Xanthomendoza cf. fulva]